MSRSEHDLWFRFCSLLFKFTLLSYKNNMGICTNNLVEFKELYFMFKFALDRDISNLPVFGDSTLVIYWMIDQLQMQSNLLLPLVVQLKQISGHFQFNK